MFRTGEMLMILEMHAQGLSSAAFPELSATRLLREVPERGYAGGLTALKDFVRTVRPQAARPSTTFSTASPPCGERNCRLNTARISLFPGERFTEALAPANPVPVTFRDRELLILRAQIGSRKDGTAGLIRAGS